MSLLPEREVEVRRSVAACGENKIFPIEIFCVCHRCLRRPAFGAEGNVQSITGDRHRVSTAMVRARSRDLDSTCSSELTGEELVRLADAYCALGASWRIDQPDRKGSWMSRKWKRSVSVRRRDVIKLATGAALAMPTIFKASAAQKQIVVRDSGGPFTPAFEAAFYKPFREATGIEIVAVTSPQEPTAQIKSMVDTKTYTWNIASLSFSGVDSLMAQGDYLEPHGLEKADFISEIPTDYMHRYAVSSDVYATALGFRKDRMKGAMPTKWADVWDTATFPGRRCLRRFPYDTVELSLMADGVPSADVYPCDVDRAFKKLDQIKPQVATWWAGAAQVTQMLLSGEIDIVPCMNARLQAAIDGGAPVGIAWNQNLWGVDGWTILKGSPHQEECRQFIKFCSDPRRQAAFTPFVANGPTNPNAYKFIDEKRARSLPTFSENRAVGVKINNAFWAKNQARVVERFNGWLLT